MHQGVTRIENGAFRSWLEATPTTLILSGSGILPRWIHQWTTQPLGLLSSLNNLSIRCEIPLQKAGRWGFEATSKRQYLFLFHPIKFFYLTHEIVHLQNYLQIQNLGKQYASSTTLAVVFLIIPFFTFVKTFFMSSWTFPRFWSRYIVCKFLSSHSPAIYRFVRNLQHLELYYFLQLLAL